MTGRGPLVELTSIRARLAILVGLSILVAAAVGTIGTQAGVPWWLGLPATVAVALVFTRWLATGMTTPLREMTRAADRMARGDYGVQITTSGRDEVATLARAFSTMALELAEGEEHRRRLVATVAHELRTPLSAQQALLENLVDGVTVPDDAALRNALAQSERLGSLVADLLDLSRPDGAGVQLTPTRIIVGELLEQAAGEAALQPRRVTLVADVEPPDLSVTGDRARLAQAMANLLDNAIRHSPAGGTVTMTARAGGDRWSLTVTDEGPGLSPERADRLVHRFGTGGDHGGGTGLGLAIAGWAVAMHGGTLRAIAPTGQPGARVRMDLPLIPPTPSIPTRVPLSPAHPDLTPQEHPMSDHHVPATHGVGRGTAARDGSAPAAPSNPAPAHPASFALSPAHWWPERATDAQPRWVLAALAVGFAAAVLLPMHPLGLGMLVVLSLGGLALWMASPRRAAPWSWFTAALALPLASTTVLRADPGSTFLALMTAGVLAATACTDARSVTGICAGVLAWPAAALRGLPLLDTTVRALASRGRAWSILRTGAVSLVLLLVFGGLLSSADALFGSWTARLVPQISDALVFRVFTFVFFAGITLAGLYLSINPPPVDRLRANALTHARVPAREWQVPMGVVIAVFVAFLIAQAAALVGGHAYVVSTTGVTYAEAAREGFGQLTLVTALVLMLIAGVRAWGRVGSRRDRRAMTVMSAVLCALALLVVASALRRMALYQEAFGFTTLRVGADLIEIWLGIIVLAVLVSLFVPSRRWLGRTVLVSGTLLMVLWSVGNTSAWVAERNIERWAETGKLDEAYLASLPDDALPAIHSSSLPPSMKSCIIAGEYHPGTSTDTSLPAWNLARGHAAAIRAEYTRPTTCSFGR